MAMISIFRFCAGVRGSWSEVCRVSFCFVFFIYSSCVQFLELLNGDQDEDLKEKPKSSTQSKFPSATLGYSVLRIFRLDGAFSGILQLEASPVEGRKSVHVHATML